MPRTTFPTALGTCAVTWGDGGLTSFELPGAVSRADDTTSPPFAIAAIVARVQRHVGGQAEDFADLRYDFSHLSEFNRRVLQATLGVKSGRTTTYGQIATAMGESPAASRGVGQMK